MFGCMGFSLLVSIESYSVVVVFMLLIVMASLGARALRRTGFSCCGMWALECWLNCGTWA